MTEIHAYHGIHAAAPTSHCGPVEWFRPTPRADRVRVRTQTCECTRIVYELCAAGGLSFVRRRDRSGGGVIVTESEWMPCSRSEALWLRILAGQAR